KTFHSAAGSDRPTDGGIGVGGHHRLPAVADLCIAASGLSNHSSTDVLSGREPGGNDFGCDSSARAAIWPGARAEPDDLHQLVRQFADHASVFTGSEYRYRGAGGAGGNQRFRYLPAKGPAESSGI